MASLSISEALKVVHERRRQQHGLWRLDSPTEAALVAQLCNRQRDEEVIGTVSLGLPELTNYQFSELGPHYMSEKMRHMYALGQNAQYCGVVLARQRGLLPPQQQKQQPGQPGAAPCSPAAAAAPVCAAQDEQTLHASCRTPLSQLRAEHQQQEVEDCSPCNNSVRRLAANIKAGSPALHVTLQDLARRSISSLRSRTSTHSDSDQQERTTPLASPGRAWAQPPASCILEPLVFDLQDASTSAVPSLTGDHPPAAGPEQLPTPSAHKQLGTEDSGDGCQDNSMHCQQGLAAGAVPSLLFKGFGTEGRAHAQAALASAESAELCTPRLEPCWPPLHSNASSSNGTALCSEYSHFSSGGGSLGAVAVHTAAPVTANWAPNKHTNENEAAAAACGSASAQAGRVSANSAGICRSRTGASTAGTDSPTGTDYSSCHGDDDMGEEFDCAAAGKPLCTPPPLTRALSETAGQVCQLPLSPLLLKQLDTSLQEAGAQHAPHPEDDVNSCCDWATVCSYEEYE